jgi:PAS domain S-box-containing protein
MPQKPLSSSFHRSKLLQLPLLQPRSQLMEVADRLELAIAVWDLQQMQVRLSPALARLYGFETQGFETQGFETQGFETQGFEAQDFEAQGFETHELEPNCYGYGQFLDCVHPSDRPHVQSMIQAAATRRQKYAVDYRITNLAGQVVWLSSQGHVFERSRDTGAKTNKNIELIEVVQDVTPRYQSRSALAENNAQWNALLEKSDELLIQTDEEACIFWMSPASQRLLGYLPEGLVGEQFLDLIHPDERIKVEHAFESLSSSHVPQTFQHSIRQRSGDYLPVQSTLRFGEDLGSFAVLSCSEITARLDVQSALDSTYAAYTAIVDQVTDLVFRLLSDGTIAYGNQAFWQYFQRSPEQGIGLNFYRDLLIGQSPKPFLPEAIFRRCCAGLTVENPTVIEQYPIQSGRRVQQQSYRIQALFNSDHALLEYQIIMSTIS